MNSLIKLSSLSLTLIVALLLASCSKEAPEIVESLPVKGEQPKGISHRDLLTAQAAINAYATALKAELTAALQQGGPVNAIQVCNTGAAVIGEKVSNSHGVTIHRVSLKNRSPLNSPDDWQRGVLESFDQQQQRGLPPHSLDWSQTAEIDGVKEFRYMKAIPTAGLCLQCHGQSIAPAVSQAISELYPEDAATGFSEGQIRGAFVVTGRASN